MYISRIALRPDASIGALLGAGLASGGGHGLLWSLFADGPDRRRDFIYRLDGQSRRPAYIAVSARPPRDAHDLFDVETKDYRLDLRPGDRLAFTARLNAVRAVAPPGRDGRSKHVDVVMDALRRWKADHAGDGGAAPDRLALAQGAVGDWLAARGERCGFELERDAFAVTAYDVVEPRTSKHRDLRFGVSDVVGRLRVSDPGKFAGMLFEGLGAGRAYGHGLVLVRRV